MSFFKSKEQRRIERDMEIKKGINRIRRQISDLQKSEIEWLTKAKRARDLGSGEQAAFMRKTLKATVFQRRMLERQLLTLEAAFQMKNQAESYASFAESMNHISKSIAEVYNSTDLEKTQTDFARAVERGESMSQRMDLFLDMTKDSIFTTESSMGEEVISDAEIDKMMGLDPGKERARTREELEREIAAELGDENPQKDKA